MIDREFSASILMKKQRFPFFTTPNLKLDIKTVNPPVDEMSGERSVNAGHLAGYNHCVYYIGRHVDDRLVYEKPRAP